MLKVLIYSKNSWPAIGGVETTTHALAEGLSRQGVQVALLTETRSPVERTVSYEIIRSTSFFQWWQLVRKYDLLHVQVPRSQVLFPALAFLLCRRPVTVGHHGFKLIAIDPCLFRNGKPVHNSFLSEARHHIQIFGLLSLFKACFELCCNLLLTNCATANIVVSRHLAMRQPVPRQIIIPAPVELESWLATDAGDATKSSPFAFTFLGRLDKGKGVDDLLRAFAGLCEDPEINGRSDLKLKIIGDGPKKNELLALCRKLKIEAKVEWTGWKTGEELAHEIKQSGLFVVPSAIEEPLGVVVLELMAAGKSLIVPFYGGATEYAGDACLTFINGSVESLADAMKKAYLNPELQEQLSTLALERAKLFRPEIGMREYRDLFEKLVAKMAERN